MATLLPTTSWPLVNVIVAGVVTEKLMVSPTALPVFLCLFI